MNIVPGTTLSDAVVCVQTLTGSICQVNANILIGVTNRSPQMDILIKSPSMFDRQYFQGDSGSPLMCLKDDKYHLCGITSGGSVTSSPSNSDPVFFTSTPSASLMLWIRENTQIVGESYSQFPSYTEIHIRPDGPPNKNLMFRSGHVGPKNYT